MHQMLLDLPDHIETDRLILRPYRPGDGTLYYLASQRNRDHLSRYESGNALMEIDTEEDAEIIVREFAADWVSRRCFFLGAWEKASGVWVGQVYIGPVNWSLPEFEIGYIADVDHEGRGCVTEAVRASLRLIFDCFGAHRVRLMCDETNERSIRVAERCGFTREAHIRDDMRHPDGSFTGTLHYGLLRREFYGRP